MKIFISETLILSKNTLLKESVERANLAILNKIYLKKKRVISGLTSDNVFLFCNHSGNLIIESADS